MRNRPSWSRRVASRLWFCLWMSTTPGRRRSTCSPALPMRSTCSARLPKLGRVMSRNASSSTHEAQLHTSVVGGLSLVPGARPEAAEAYQPIQDVLRTPFESIGKPELLKANLKGFWSRRINDEHRLVYTASD